MEEPHSFQNFDDNLEPCPAKNRNHNHDHKHDHDHDHDHDNIHNHHMNVPNIVLPNQSNPLGIITDDNDNTSINEPSKSTQMASNSRRSSLGFLASANFSADSLVDAQTLLGITPTTPKHGSNSTRRYSNNSLLNSPVLQPPSHSTRGRSRPLSAFLMDSTNAIEEDGDESSFANYATSPEGAHSFRINNDGVNSGVNGGVNGATNNSPQNVSISTYGNGFYNNNSINNYSRRGSSPTRGPPPSPPRSPSPVRVNKNFRAKSPVRRSLSPTKSGPFNFKPQEIMVHGKGSNSSLQVKPAHRKGHRYKHSSVSMNMFQEPPLADLAEKAPLKSIADLYPIPNYKEAFASISKSQKGRLAWSACHFATSLLVFYTGFNLGVSSLSTLAHLIFYDSLGSLFIVLVDVMANFEVWKKPSISFPFGLERLEVLVGFALSASLVMLGFDLFSHFFEELVLSLMSHDNEDHGEHDHLSHHVHEELGPVGNIVAYEVVLLISLAVSLVSSNVILAYDRINDMLNSTSGKAQQYNGFSKGKINYYKGGSTTMNSATMSLRILNMIKAWRSYPTYLVTITYIIFLIVVPIIPGSWVQELAYDIQKCANILVACLLCYNGWNLVKFLGGTLLCAFPYSDYQNSVTKSNIMDQITGLDCFKHGYLIQKLFVTKFSYSLYVIGVCIEMKGANADDEVRMKFETNRIIENEVKKLERGLKVAKCEITIDIDRF